MTIADTLAAIRALAEAEKCTTEHFAPSIEVISVPGGLYPVPCEQADCTGLNPAYAPMLNVVRVECDKCFHGGYTRKCRNCHGTGYVARSWGDVPGALRGGLEWAVKQAPQAVYLSYGNHLEPDADTDEASADAVLAAMEGLEVAHA